MYLKAAAATATVAAVILTACGSDAEALSKAEFIEQADAICQASMDEAEPIFQAVWADLDDEIEPDLAEDVVIQRFADAMDAVRPIFEQQLDDIEDLEPPSEDRELLDSLLADQRAAMAEFARMLDAAAAGESDARSAIVNDEDPFADVDRWTREYGFAVCGQDDE